jgi:hypothetical protein
VATGLPAKQAESGVHILFIETTVLGYFCAARENYTGVDLQDDVGRSRIAAGIVKFISHRLPREDFLNAQRSLVFGLADVRNDAAQKFLVCEPYERAIVRNNKRLTEGISKVVNTK